jgi:hypothetical protein
MLAPIYGTLIGEDPNSSNQHTVKISIRFAYSLFSNKYCIAGNEVTNYIGGIETYVPKSEPIEYIAAKDVSNQNCESYISSKCGVHITQYQKNKEPNLHPENYHFNVSFYDGKQELISKPELLSIPSGKKIQVRSTLPYKLGVTGALY